MNVIIPLVLTLSMSLLVLMPVCAADMKEAEKQASALKHLGLFKGVSDTDFDLDRVHLEGISPKLQERGR